MRVNFEDGIRKKRKISKKNMMRKNISEHTDKAKKFLKKDGISRKVSGIRDLAIFVSCYGIIIDIILYSFFSFGIGLINSISCGFAYYLISQEIPIMIRKSRGGIER